MLPFISEIGHRVVFLCGRPALNQLLRPEPVLSREFSRFTNSVNVQCFVISSPFIVLSTNLSLPVTSLEINFIERWLSSHIFHLWSCKVLLTFFRQSREHLSIGPCKHLRGSVKGRLLIEVTRWWFIIKVFRGSVKCAYFRKSGTADNYILSAFKCCRDELLSVMVHFLFLLVEFISYSFPFFFICVWAVSLCICGHVQDSLAHSDTHAHTLYIPHADPSPGFSLPICLLSLSVFINLSFTLSLSLSAAHIKVTWLLLYSWDNLSALCWVIWMVINYKISLCKLYLSAFATWQFHSWVRSMQIPTLLTEQRRKWNKACHCSVRHQEKHK